MLLTAFSSLAAIDWDSYIKDHDLHEEIMEKIFKQAPDRYEFITSVLDWDPSRIRGATCKITMKFDHTMSGASDAHWMTFFTAAVLVKDKEMIKLLIERGQIVCKELDTNLCGYGIAKTKGYTDIIELIDAELEKRRLKRAASTEE